LPTGPTAQAPKNFSFRDFLPCGENMKLLKTLYKGLCRVEEFLVSLFIVILTFLVFLSALARSIKHPINWAQDISLLLFAWVVFLGADLALQKADFLRVDMLMRLFPRKIQKFLYYFFYVVVIGFLGLLVWHGIALSLSNAKRLFQTLEISYSWATISVPVGSILLGITIIIRLVKYRKNAVITVNGKEAI
jgi:TRAP-type C4-dicarboxylate transport system permease small subunit